MAIGGFSGSDPAPTLAEFQQMVASHEIHYFVAGAGGGFCGFPAGGFGGGPVASPAGPAEAADPVAGGGGAVAGDGGGSDAAQITSWVESHFTAQTVGGMTVYNLTTAPNAGS